ncbi:MAG: DUF1553 domain-containing protein [Phycisphaera sp.]|nr:DUF1553 domain-containing protein [Phycisphaera sp.]
MKHRYLRRLAASAVTASVIATLLVAVSAQGATPAGAVRFDRDIRPLLSDKCFHCHGPSEKDRKAKLRLDLREEATADHKGITAIVPGDLENSEAWQRITAKDSDDLMPPPKSNKTLSAEEKDLIKRWIEQGAKWSKHWSFVAPERPELPKVSNEQWVKNAIDRFVMARLDAEGLKPSPEADRRTLIRRVTLDMTGLPPTVEDVEAFVADKSPNAYEKMVDRVLASPRYGQRMASMWLDAARYGDTSVHHADGPRQMWAWRDHIVNAYNQNQPFDQFSTEQLAGDLLPDATVVQKLASGFNRNNATTDEGGAIAEEYRVEYAVDRVKTTSTVWLGLTMECGQCHEHKYDPITHDEYYQFYAFFNISADGGMQTRKGNAAPMVSVPDEKSLTLLPDVRAKIADEEEKLKAREQAMGPEFEAWLKKTEADFVLDNKAVNLVPTDALAYYPLDEEKGNKVVNDTDEKSEGEVKGGDPQWVEAKNGRGLKLDGKAYVDLGNVGDFERTDGFSYGGWIYTDGPANGAPIARMDGGNDYRGYDMLLQNGMVTAHIINKWPTNAIKIKTKKKLTPKEWHHVMVTYDGSSKAAGVTVYVDGASWEWDIEQDRLSATIRTPKNLLIGTRHGGSRFTGIVDDMRVFGRTLTASEVQALAGSDPLGPIFATPAAQRTDEQVAALRNHYLYNVDKDYKTIAARRDELKAKEAELQKPLTTVMVMADMAKPRDTFVLNRGQYDQPTKVKVEPGTPAVLPPMPEGAPRNRLGLAQWLFSKEHPLTSRVAVNRYWLMLFGNGIVNTPGDFGSQGEFPSHPELLDWLAVDFRESGWDVKRMIKQIMMSATYRQSSKMRPDLMERDPQNRLLARGARYRLQGEFIRDTALYLSGLLVDEMGGPGVKPYQPPGLWAEVGLGGNPKFTQDHGDALYRRSLYTYWKRSAPPPSMIIFDAPTREKCEIGRARTNTPLQALVTLNDVQFVETARALAQRMIKQGGATPQQRVDFAFALATARQPSASERDVLLDVFNAAKKKYAADKDAATQLVTFGESKRDGSIDVSEHAAWTIVASTILNLDETLTRE